VSDGYGNACVHKYTLTAKLLKTWRARHRSGPVQHRPQHRHRPGWWVYVADPRTPVQVFDGNAIRGAWNNLHALRADCCGGKQPNFIIGELGPDAGEPESAEFGPAPQHRGFKGKRIARSAARVVPA